MTQVKKISKILPAIVIVIVLVNAFVACSTQKNTARSRWWHSFNARYNTYYNGAQAYIAGSLEKENGNKDNFTDFIPLYTVSNKSSRELGKGNYETAITKSEKAIKKHSIKARPEWKKSRKKTEKDIEWLSRREYNPFIWKAWMLMGRSQFYKGAFDEAAATFSYMSRLYKTQPSIYGKARAWLAKCYIEQDWIYDAEDVIRNMKRDSIDYHAQKEWDYTMADYYVHTQDWKNAAPAVMKVIKHEMRSRQRAREWYLLGQIYGAMKDNANAYNAFKHVIRLNPPYELEFNARIAMTEVLPEGQSRQKLRKLRAMARSDKNKDYLDQVYYAMGNVYLAEKDTMHAIYSYEKGNKGATRSGIEKGVLLLHLGDLYFAKEKFGDAQRCYGEAIGLLDKERKDYEQLSYRSKILDELAPFTESIHLQDSLQELAKMSEKDRNAAIDRVIDALKKKEKEEKLNKLEEQARQQGAQGNQDINNNTVKTSTPTQTKGQATFYFYNPQAVSQGKQTFQQQWGKRENADNWQRVNKTVVSTGSETDSEEVSDSIVNNTDGKGLAADSVAGDKAKTDSAALDPHKREYYLAQIPFTEEQVAASNQIIADGLYNSGIIFKDKLDDLRLCERQLTRLIDNFPDFENMDIVYYHLFLLYSRKGQDAKAKSYVDLMDEKYKDSEYTKIVTDPYFRENAQFGVQMEDSLYAATYDAFNGDRFNEVEGNCRLSEKRFHDGANHDKFVFISGLSRLNQGDADSCVNAMNRVVKDYPQSDVAGIAGMIINGVKAGKKLHGAKFDIANIWDYRSTVLNDNEATEQKFSDDPNQEFVFLMTYNPDSLIDKQGTYEDARLYPENKLLYALARYNFSNYLVRNFNIDIEEYEGMHRLSVSGFRNYDEALVYARSLYKNTDILALSPNSRNIIISKTNLALLGTRFSYNDYDKFYAEHFQALPTPRNTLLKEPVIDPSLYDPETLPSEPKAEEEEKQQDNSQDDSGITIPETPAPATPATPAEDNTIAIPEEKPVAQPVDDNTIAIPEEKPVVQPVDDNTIAIPEEKPVAQPVDDNTIVIPEESKTATPSVSNDIIIPDEPAVKEETPVAIPNATTPKATPVTTPKATPEAAPKTSTADTPQKKQTATAKKEQTESTTRQDINADIIEIIDESAPQTTPEPDTKEKKEEKQDDEYFDLDGF